jgi:hypothetical protein
MTKPATIHATEAGGALISLPGEGTYFARLATLPSDGGAGYAPGCVLTITGTVKLYQNTGTLASAVWTIVGSES